MKKLLTLLLCALTLMISAQNSTGTVVLQSATGGPATASVSIAPVPDKNHNTESASVPRSARKGEKGYKFKDRPVMYICAGVLVVVIVVLYAVTGGAGVSSR
jgi:hypothetical protein